MAAVDEQTLLHDVEQRFLRLSQKLEACEKERDDLRASQGKSDEQISALTLSQSAALRGEADRAGEATHAEAARAHEGDLAAEKRLAVALVDEADAAARDRDAFEETAKKAEASGARARANLDAEVARQGAERRGARRGPGVGRRAVEGDGGGAGDADGARGSARGRAGGARARRPPPTGPAAMYERAVDAERAAERARAELKRNELYLERVAREVEKKAEVFDREVAARKSAVAAYDALAIKHHGALQELEQSKTDAAAALKRAREEKHERSDLERSKRDLALQVQELLRVRTGKSPSGLVEARLKKNSAEEQALGEQLVVFDDVAGLQQRNEQLLRVVRKLAAEAEAKKLEEAEGETSGALEQALKDLEDLKSKREQQETMVRAVVAQRDSYRDQLRARGEVAAIVAAPAAAALTADPAAAALRRAEVEADLEAAARERDLAKQATAFARDAELAAKRELAEARAAEGRLRGDLEYERSRTQRLESSAEASRLGEQAALAEAAGLHRQLDRRTDDHEKLVEDKAAWMDEKADLARAKKAADDALDGARAAKQDAEAKVEALSRENDRLVAALDGVRKLENALDAKSEAEVTSLRSRLEAAENQRGAAAQELALSQETHRVKFKALEADAAAARDEAKAAEARRATREAATAKAQAEKDGAERRLADALRSVPPSSAPASSPFVEARAAPAAADADSAATARDAYERELGLHAAHVAALNAATAACKAAVASATPALKKAAAATPEAPAPAPAAADDEAAKRLAALERQNELLHAQIAVASSTVGGCSGARGATRFAGGGDAPRAPSEVCSRVEREPSRDADAAKHKAAAEALRAQLDKVHASHVEPKHKLVAQLKAQVATKEQERVAARARVRAWRKRVDALLSKVTEKIDADEYRAVEEKLRKAEDQLADATEAAAAPARSAAAKTKIERYLRSLRADGLHRRSLTDAAAAAEKVKARAGRADASNAALKDELVRAEAKVRKAAGMMRQYKAQNAALQVKVDAVPAAPPAAAVPVRRAKARRRGRRAARGAAPRRPPRARPAPAPVKRARAATDAAAAPAAAEAAAAPPAKKSKQPTAAARRSAPYPSPRRARGRGRGAGARDGASPAAKAAAKPGAAKASPAAAKKQKATEAAALRAKLLALQKSNAEAKKTIEEKKAEPADDGAASPPPPAVLSPLAPTFVPVLSPVFPPAAPPAEDARPKAVSDVDRRKARAARFAGGAAPAPAPPDDDDEDL
ncbi:spindle assembly checkpoint protein [Aureococcus anophagefferens]|uniref:Spindle assembly checkpoint protein n=1 Tax=Aureococcus anophagefferens TaxID=44056 RepID=A0ABR1GF17_AURAN